MPQPLDCFIVRFPVYLPHNIMNWSPLKECSLVFVLQKLLLMQLNATVIKLCNISCYERTHV
jgi:hypothetical protein